MLFEELLRNEHKEGFAEGKAEGKAEGLAEAYEEILALCGDSSEELRQQILDARDRRIRK